MPCHLIRYSHPLLPNNGEPLTWPRQDKFSLLWGGGRGLLLCGNERTVCEVGNPKLQSSTPWSLHPPNPRPQKVPRWPSQSIHVQALPGGYSSLPFQLPHTTLRQDGTLCTSVCASVSFCPCLHACLHTHICRHCYLPFLKKALKGKVWMGE